MSTFSHLHNLLKLKLHYKTIIDSILFIFFILIFHLLTTGCSTHTINVDIGWPEENYETKPWTRWWWFGNSIQLETLPQVMDQYKQAGFGGLEITPIYGVKNDEENFIDYLSPEWMDLLVSTLKIGDSLNLGIDMANSSGWPFGGPWITSEYACKNFVYKKYKFRGGQHIDQSIVYMQKPFVRRVRGSISIDDIRSPISKNKNLHKLALAQVRFHRTLPLVSLMAYSNSGNIVDLTDKVDTESKLNWKVPPGEWDVYAVFQGWHGKMVERASPGGEGNVIDHFSRDALNKHLEAFELAFYGKNMKSIRAFFNDSYEVDDADGESNFSMNFLEEFRKRRGYDLRMHLPSFFYDVPTDEHVRILCDYRETISDLLLEEFTVPWKNWAHKYNVKIRNQAHGSPANILDLYAASDIPETEGTDLINIKFASSAAHLTGKKLTSAEACTWLNEHFQTTLSQIKNNVDNYFLGGVNHIIYHGTPYSPPDDKWPGWLFYASVHFGPTNTFWNDLSTLNNYITRCQSFLQSGQPDNDILIYYPIYDRWSVPSQSLLKHFHGEEEGVFVKNLSQNLLNLGYSFDFVSDKQISALSVKNNRIFASSSVYKTIIVPDTKLMPLSTFEALLKLAKYGVNVLFINDLPVSIPGFGFLEERQEKYNKVRNKIKFSIVDKSNFYRFKLGKGFFYKGTDIINLLSHININAEPMVNDSLQFVKRKLDDGSALYFIVNRGKRSIDKWIKLNDSFSAILYYNPMNGLYGKAATTKEGEVYVQLNTGDACILQALSRDVSIDNFKYFEKNKNILFVKGSWNVKFIQGGPELPATVVMDQLKSWTDIDYEIYKRFSGKAVYTILLNNPNYDGAEAWLLDLGEVRESAEVFLNGKKIATCIKEPYHFIIDRDLLKETNLLEVHVSNLMANRISYMDKEEIEWKKFHDINFPAKDRENIGNDGLFNAGGWTLFKSGLIGPVKLIPLQLKFRN